MTHPLAGLSDLDLRQPVNVAFRLYSRRFNSPLMTHHGAWTHREGALVRVEMADGRCGYGEIAPLPWFGSEGQENAIALCRRLAGQQTMGELMTISPHYPACQFGFECAVDQAMRSDAWPDARLSAADVCALLPAGEKSLSAWLPLWEKGHQTFKWKIGVEPTAIELNLFDQLIAQLPNGAKLRLDANGGLTVEACEAWLKACDDVNLSSAGPQIDFLEQALPPDHAETMLAVSQQYQTPLALDESVSNLAQLTAFIQKGWPGIFVLKPAILGSPTRLMALHRAQPFDWVISSVFETAIGRRSLLALASDLRASEAALPRRALGMGTVQWLPEDGLNLAIQTGDVPGDEQVWKTLNERHLEHSL